MLNNCISNKNFKETRALYSVSDNIETLIGSKTDEFILENVELIYLYLHKTTLKRGYSYIECPEQLQNKTVTINPKKTKKNYYYFQYTITSALNHQYIERDHQRILKIEPILNHYNWKGLDYPSHQNDWEKFEKNNTTNALNILFLASKTKEIRTTYRSK